MEALRVVGGRPLRGRISVSGSKNASLPAMAASLLAAGDHMLWGAPDLTDVRTLALVLGGMGVRVRRHDHALRMEATNVTHVTAPYDLVRTMRASILVLGPLLARFHRARVSLPGGCAIGARPIDQHIEGLRCLGARLTVRHGYVEAEAPGGLVGNAFTFRMPTVTGTENLMLAATLARGTTVLHNAACEPEVEDLGRALAGMGARIEGAGTSTVRIEGQPRLSPLRHRVLSDRIEFGTYLVAGALAGAPLTVCGGDPAHQGALVAVLQALGCGMEFDGSQVRIGRHRPGAGLSVATGPYPQLATDMQAQLMVLMALSNGDHVIEETVFENRFMHVAELVRLGARIRVCDRRAYVAGSEALSATTVMATDLRASACLVLAALAARGTTTIRRIYHLDRGYEAMDAKLRAVGADIERFREGDALGQPFPPEAAAGEAAL